MELDYAKAKADQILDEERAWPTVKYEPSQTEHPHPVVYAAGTMLAATQLQNFYMSRPRIVMEGQRRWGLASTNYNLLRALLAQLPPSSRAALFDHILLRTSSEISSAVTRSGPGQWKGLVSELPLVAELCVRNGASQRFFSAFRQAAPVPSMVILLQHLEDMIGLEFTVFSDEEYKQLDSCVDGFRNDTQGLLKRYAGGSTMQAGGRRIDVSVVLNEIQTSSNAVREVCRKARYLYLKGSLLEGFNIELNQDKDAVQNYLGTLGFTPTLNRSLNEAERLYRESAGEFDLKAGMGHLRSFLENLHTESFSVLHNKLGGVAPTGWGQGLTYLRRNRIISEAEEKFAAGLYTLISDQAVHPLVAEREYARLARNVVIEYALLFLRNLEKLGFKMSA